MSGHSAVGLDIGTSSVRAAEVTMGRNGITLDHFGQMALPEGSVRDGEVVDAAAVAQAIKLLWKGAKIGSRKVAIGVANQRVVVRQVEIPWLPADELKKSLPLLVQDLIPMPVDEAVLDFVPLEDITSSDGSRQLKGLLVAAAEDMVMNAVQAVRLAGLIPTVVDLTSFAVLRANVTASGTSNYSGLNPSGKAEAVVDIGARVTNIVVHDNGVPKFVRILLMGGHDTTEALVERLGVGLAEAEALKRELGANSEGSETDPTRTSAAKIIRTSVTTLIDEIRGSLDYYQATAGTGSLTQCTVSGGGACLPGLMERLETAVRVPVIAGNALAGLAAGKTGLSVDQLRFVEPYAVASVGLALGAAS